MTKLSILPLAFMILWSTYSIAAGTQYALRVDGLACPFCAYGIEKILTKTKGVESVRFDIEKGLVIVHTMDGITLTKKQLKRLINDAGFTLKSMTEQALTSTQ